jgi:hypothetical protein
MQALLSQVIEGSDGIEFADQFRPMRLRVEDMVFV